MKNNLFVADFETTVPEEGTPREDMETRVWAFAVASISDVEVVARGTSIDAFMGFCCANPGATIYFHNLKFDGQFILSWLLNNGFTWTDERKDKPHTFRSLIGDMGQFYKLEVVFGYLSDGHQNRQKAGKCAFLDSLKKLNFSVAEIAKAFNLPMSKGEIDYCLPRPEGYEPTLEEWDYVDRDVLIVAAALNSMFSEGLDAMTAGADALNYFKETIGGKERFEKWFPILPKDVDDFIRKAYKGGFTYLNPTKKNQDFAGCVYDVNSMYPWAMHEKPLPYGKPFKFEGAPNPKRSNYLWIAQVRVSFALKKGKIPCIQLKNNPRYLETEYLTHNTSEDGEVLTITSVDWALIQECYNVEVHEWFGGYYFKNKTGLFNAHIDHFMEQKANNKGAKRTQAKLMLNSLYGKFGTNPEKRNKIPYLDERGVVRYRLSELDIDKPVYTALACFVTAYARENIILAAIAAGERFIYCDTDSLHIIGTEPLEGIEVHETRLGAYKLESTFQHSRFIRAKTYLEEDENGLTVKCAGMPKNVKKQVTFNDFFEGAKYDGKLIPRNVRGGCVLLPDTFTIKVTATP